MHIYYVCISRNKLRFAFPLITYDLGSAYANQYLLICKVGGVCGYTKHRAEHWFVRILAPCIRNKPIPCNSGHILAKYKAIMSRTIPDVVFPPLCFLPCPRSMGADSIALHLTPWQFPWPQPTSLEKFALFRASRETFAMGEAPSNQMLPRPVGDEQACVEIKPFETGLMTTSCATLIENAKGRSIATSWRFLLKHSKTNTHFWFDMGISHVSKLRVYPF